MASPSLPAAFGVRLRQLRLAKGMSQGELATKVGLSANAVSNLERGTSGPSFSTVGQLAEALDVDLIELFWFGSGDVKGRPRRQLLDRLLALVRDLDDDELASAIGVVEASLKLRR